MSTVHRELAPAKLTRSLRVVGRRTDGYHLLESEMVTVDLVDELEIAEGTGLEIHDAVDWGEGAHLTPGDIDIEEPPDLGSIPTGPENLVNRALSVAGRSAFVRLAKTTPPGAGLGGGSADVAAILRWANVTDLEQAASLGADVPFCLVGGRAMVTGIGECLEHLAPEPYAFLLVTPGFSVSTAEVYTAFDDLGTGVTTGSNDLERAAMATDPRLGRWRDFLTEVAGRRPSLAGSGSTLFFECSSGDAGLEQAVRSALRATRTRAQVRFCHAVGPDGRTSP